MSTQFVFVHGWGMAPDFWDALIECLPEGEAHKIDLGFIVTQQSLPKASNPAIYVTHSLGTMWALKHCHADMKGLIAINGFSCFQNFTDKKTLRAMKVRLKREPQAQMKNFWKICGLPENEGLNVEKLKEGLDWLSSWDTKDELKALQCPVLSLAGSDDPILPISQMEKEWDGFDLRVCEKGGHALPISDTTWCAEQIKAWMNEF